MVFTCSLLSWSKISSPFRENNTASFPHLMPLANLWIILRTRSFPDLYPLVRSSRRPFVFGRGRILVLEFMRSPATLAIYGIAHSIPLGGVDRDFPFTEDETQRNFLYLSCTFRELIFYRPLNWNRRYINIYRYTRTRKYIVNICELIKTKQ